MKNYTMLMLLVLTACFGRGPEPEVAAAERDAVAVLEADLGIHPGCVASLRQVVRDNTAAAWRGVRVMCTRRHCILCPKKE